MGILQVNIKINVCRILRGILLQLRDIGITIRINKFILEHFFLTEAGILGVFAEIVLMSLIAKLALMPVDLIVITEIIALIFSHIFIWSICGLELVRRS